MASQPFDLRGIIAELQLESNVPPRPPGSDGPLQRRLVSLSRSSSVNTTLRPTIECAEVWGNNIYLGTTDGTIVTVSVDDRVSYNASGEAGLPRYTIVQRRNVGSARRVERLVAVPSLRKLIAFCDSALSFYALPTLNPFPAELIPSVRGVTCFCVSPRLSRGVDGQGSLRICVAKRRAIHMYRLANDLLRVKEFVISDSAVVMCCNDQSICYADSRDYRILDMDSDRSISIFPVAQSDDSSSSRNASAVRPVIATIGDSEFILVNTTLSTHILDVAQRKRASQAVARWNGKVRHVHWAMYSHPFVVALLRNGAITVHHVDTQQQLQVMDVRALQARSLIQGPGITVCHTALAEKLSRPDVDSAQAASSLERNFILSQDSVTAMVALPIVEVADRHLQEKHVEEAVMLVETYLATHEGMHFKSMGIMYIYRKAGLICFGETLFDDALAFFRKGELDPRVLVNLFPELALQHYKVPVEHGVRQLVDQMGSIHNIISTHLTAFGSTEDEQLRAMYMTNATDMLLKYLKMCKESGGIPGGEFADDLDTLLLRLYTDVDEQGLLRLLSGDNNCHVEACAPWLEKHEKHYALSLLHRSHGNLREAMAIWKRIVDGELSDAAFGGLEELTSALVASKDRDLLFEFTPWVLATDAAAGVVMLTRLQEDADKPLSDDEMFTMIQEHGPSRLITFLEQLVLRQQTNDPSKHDALAQIYITRLGELLDKTPDQLSDQLDAFHAAQRDNSKEYFALFLQHQPGKLARMRSKLLQFLQTSKLYTPDAVLASLQDIQLIDVEACVVLVRLERYEEALHLLVDDLRDFVGAEMLCYGSGAFARMGGEVDAGHAVSRQMFTTLLDIYLNQPGEYQEANVTRLLSSFSHSLDAITALRSLPDHWSAEIVGGFLIQAVRRSTSASREQQILRALAHTELNKASAAYIARAAMHGPIALSENTLCRVCKKPFTSPLSGCQLRRGRALEVEHVHCMADQ
ncbi:hypothetical protein THASP1DRAFT_29275 [Thamnocephalis sphaerospora]|uniref:CNH domain-containing protein n=1 Tax=Thamnocephalis sphaerospora TaxID=78915 RepID=A0A4P9XTP5_9FUNG|nr:hypothetical protein THASP1DRAFT_29275 [Thamnocephalis sphaerospora]|eukprot:RKP08931.1 hypothetical protein THASP1DRAFT_29275 [Thamnocephalis sphaerospora]